MLDSRVGNPEDRFSRVMAHLSHVMKPALDFFFQYENEDTDQNLL